MGNGQGVIPGSSTGGVLRTKNIHIRPNAPLPAGSPFEEAAVV
jgi:hypothetical protein